MAPPTISRPPVAAALVAIGTLAAASMSGCGSGGSSTEVGSTGAAWAPSTTELVELPAGPLSPRVGPLIAAVGERVVVFGGSSLRDGERDGDLLDDGAVFDTSDGTWTELPPLPDEGAMTALSNQAIADDALLVGGRRCTGPLIEDSGSSECEGTGALYLLDPAERSWRPIALPEPIPYSVTLYDREGSVGPVLASLADGRQAELDLTTESWSDRPDRPDAPIPCTTGRGTVAARLDDATIAEDPAGDGSAAPMGYLLADDGWTSVPLRDGPKSPPAIWSTTCTPGGIVAVGTTPAATDPPAPVALLLSAEAGEWIQLPAPPTDAGFDVDATPSGAILHGFDGSAELTLGDQPRWQTLPFHSFERPAVTADGTLVATATNTDSPSIRLIGGKV